MKRIVTKLLALADAQRARMAMALLLAAALCLVMLAHSLSWLAGSERRVMPHALPPIDMQIVELAPAPGPVTERPLDKAPVALVPHVTPAVSATPTRRPPPASRIHAVTHADTTPPVAHDAHADARTTAPPVTSTTSSTDTAPATRTEIAPASTPNSASSTSATSVGSTTASNAPPTATSGTTQARVLSQPIPTLPDDLREQGYQLTAVARFLIHADGSVDVELVKPTQNPRLNQILLETLHRWRFFPAMQNGHPIDSEQDVRVHFSVS